MTDLPADNSGGRPPVGSDVHVSVVVPVYLGDLPPCLLRKGRDSAEYHTF